MIVQYWQLAFLVIYTADNNTKFANYRSYIFTYSVQTLQNARSAACIGRMARVDIYQRLETLHPIDIRQYVQTVITQRSLLGHCQ